jgi:hypothetical protein
MTKQSEPKVVAPAPATNFKEEEKVAPAILTLTSNGMRKEPPAPSLPKRFYGLRDAANYLGVSEQFLYQRTCRRAQMPLAIPFRRLGGKILFDIRDLEKF